METNYEVIVIGGGASGMMASIFAGRNGLKTLVLDHNEKLGKKIYITGKGKCNLTNNSSIENHLEHIVTNNKFMYSALNAFSPQDTINFFEDNGMPTRTERGFRVFPESDKASDVTKTLERLMRQYGVTVSLNNEILSVEKKNEKFNILCDTNIKYTCDSLIIATGGLSYSGTGTCEFGYNLAKQFGHHIVTPRAALCPITVRENVEELNGLSLKNVKLTILAGNKKLEEMGELMFTFTSLTGPIALTLSSLINKMDLNGAKAIIDFKPALSIQQLENKFKREFVEFAKKDLKNYLFSVLPASFVEYFLKRTKLNPNKKVADINKEERSIIIKHLKEFDFSIKSLDNINVAIITSGGVDTKEINSKTFESKLVENLYFVGEILDVDALTGGFNLQIAWSSGYVAGNSIRR